MMSFYFLQNKQFVDIFSILSVNEMFKNVDE